MVRFELVNRSTNSSGDQSVDRFTQVAPPLIGLWQDSASGPLQKNIAFDLPMSPSPPPPPPLPRVNQSNAGVRVGELVLEARGQGFGHGVGMSQWGAHGLALQGADFRQILLHYYRGAEIRPYRSSDDPAVALRRHSESAWWG